jgi:hypothetical protein
MYDVDNYDDENDDDGNYANPTQYTEIYAIAVRYIRISDILYFLAFEFSFHFFLYTFDIFFINYTERRYKKLKIKQKEKIDVRFSM